MASLPVEIDLEMYAEKPLVLPFFTGYVARGLLLHMIRQIDPTASDRLHEPNVPKPYSVTPLHFRKRNPTESGYVLDPQSPCHVSFRFLKDEYSTYLISFFQKQNSVMIFDTVFQIASMAVKAKSYVDMEKEAEALSEFKLEFRTPTYFASMGSNYHWMFPDAARVFSGLMQCWNQFSDGRQFSKEEYVAYREWLSKNIGVSKYELSTRLVTMKNKKATGFAGWATYEAKDSESEWNKVTCMLSRFAEFANVGGNRTGGFGATRALFEKGE